MPANKKRIFVVQEHNASHLHWDFRLEMNGSLRSWAIPKQPPIKIELKRLAIEVENHPLSYAKFEGEIKEGYGKGSVKIWDKGNYELLDEKPEKIVFELHGEKMKGKYVLVKTKYQDQKNDPSTKLKERTKSKLVFRMPEIKISSKKSRHNKKSWLLFKTEN